MISDDQAEATIEWTLADSAPSPFGTGETRPSETPSTDQLGPESSFSTQGGTRHIPQSLFTRHRKNAGGGDSSAPNVNNAIGVSRDRVDGCDVIAPDFRWSVSVKGVPVTMDYIKTLVAWAGKLNDAPYYNREADEWVLLGAEGASRPGDGWTLTYSFSERRNRADVQISPDISFSTVNGHDFIWVRFDEEVKAGADAKKTALQVPAAGYCERVYDTADFGRLEI